MAGIEYDRDVGIGGSVLKLSDRALEGQISQIAMGADNGKPCLLKFGGNGLCVLGRVRERRHILISGIADH